MYILIASVVLMAIFAVALPFKYGSKKNRMYFAMFRTDLPEDKEFIGEPLVFTTRKSFFFVTAYMLVALLVMVLWLMTYTRVLYESLLVVVCIVFLVIVAVGVLLLLTDHYFAKLYIYQNGFVWRSLWRSKRYFFHELDGFRLSWMYTRRGITYDMYEFMHEHESVIRLPVHFYKNITFLEEVFAETNPYVQTVLNKEL